MQSNHHDGDTSDATPGSDVHQSSASDPFVSAHASNDEASRATSNGSRAMRLRGGTAQRGRCHPTHDEGTPNASHVEEECTSRQGRTALGNDTEEDGAVENDTQEQCVESMAMESRETSPRTAEGLLSRLWPSAVAFDWTTPCFTTLAAKVTRVGEEIRLATGREGRKPHDRRSTRLPMKERREKKRVLGEYLKRSGKSVGELLQVWLPLLPLCGLSDLVIAFEGNSVDLKEPQRERRMDEVPRSVLRSSTKWQTRTSQEHS